MTTQTVEGTSSVEDQGKRAAIVGTCITAAVLAVAAGFWWRAQRGGGTANTTPSAAEMPVTAAMPTSPPLALAMVFIVGSEEEAGVLLGSYGSITDADGKSASIDQVLVVKTHEDAVRARQAIEEAHARLGGALQVIDRRTAVTMATDMADTLSADSIAEWFAELNRAAATGPARPNESRPVYIVRSEEDAALLRHLLTPVRAAGGLPPVAIEVLVTDLEGDTLVAAIPPIPGTPPVELIDLRSPTAVAIDLCGTRFGPADC